MQPSLKEERSVPLYFPCPSLPSVTSDSTMLIVSEPPITSFSITTPSSLFFSIFLLCLRIAISSDPLGSFAPRENILVNCGASGNSTSLDGRLWTGDDGANFIFSTESNQTTKSPASLDLEKDSSVDPVPYKTLRIFHSKLTYSFHVSPGQKFIRLYFPPTLDQELDRSKTSFDVSLGYFTLLRAFNPYFKSDKPGAGSIVKEFCINTGENPVLNITFTPRGAYGLISGIEVVSLPNNLYYHFISQKDPFILQNNTAIEMIHRLNIGGNSISQINDSGMFRRWSEDTRFALNLGATVANRSTQIQYTAITPPYTAPREVYQTARSAGDSRNLTWKLAVDSGFKYLLRLHFCELQQKMKRGDREFAIFIGEKMAETSADIVAWSGGYGIPVFKDYVLRMQKVRDGKKKNLSITLVPKSKSPPILNGLELFKINDTAGNLHGSNLQSSVIPPPPKRHKKHMSSKAEFAAISGASMGGITILLLVVLTICWHCNRRCCSKEDALAVPEGSCRRFTAEEIRKATNHFDRDLVIGNGGFGRVYKGYIDVESENIPVAVKVLKTTSSQGAREFRTEIEMLSTIRHHHLVSLIGYCNDEHLMILVYDYMANGTLRDHLYDTSNPPLSWKQRLEICIGAARGLHFLHSGGEHPIIHRDIKSSNILLDEKWVPKVSDFGLSRVGPTSQSRSHITTDVKGTFGYLDPEYFWTNHLTVKSDVFSFGVLLFEVLSARPAVDMTLEEEQHSLVQWARQNVKDGTINQIIDPNLRGEIAPECLKIYAKVADKCCHEQRDSRPSMSRVLKKLEKVLKLQENADAGLEEGIMPGESKSEHISLCGIRTKKVPAPRAGDHSGLLVQSCPTLWQKATSHKDTFKFSSDNAVVNKSAKPSTFGVLRALFFAVSAYKALPRDPGSMSNSDRCEPNSTSGEELVEIVSRGEPL